jgi:hypothetical protein
LQGSVVGAPVVPVSRNGDQNSQFMTATNTGVGTASPTGWPGPAPKVNDGMPQPVARSDMAGMSPSSFPQVGTQPIRSAVGPMPNVKHVNSRRVTLKYKVEAGVSGVGGVDVYLSRDDGRTWGGPFPSEISPSASAPMDARSPLPLQQSVTFELPGEGLFGVWLVVKSGADCKLASDPPGNGQPPHVRLLVDVSPPRVTLYEPRPDPSKRDTVILTWQGFDANPAPTPILLEWAEQESGEWHVIGPGELPNTGSFSWTVTDHLPPKVFLRISMRDLAGNIAVAQTSSPQLIDLKVPKPVPASFEVDVVPGVRN